MELLKLICSFWHNRIIFHIGTIMFSTRNISTSRLFYYCLYWYMCSWFILLKNSKRYNAKLLIFMVKVGCSTLPVDRMCHHNVRESILNISFWWDYRIEFAMINSDKPQKSKLIKTSAIIFRLSVWSHRNIYWWFGSNS